MSEGVTLRLFIFSPGGMSYHVSETTDQISKIILCHYMECNFDCVTLYSDRAIGTDSNKTDRMETPRRVDTAWIG